MPWTRKKGPPVPDGVLWRRCFQIARALEAPIVLENVRGAQQFQGRSLANCGPFHLWGDVPVLVPEWFGKKKESYGSKQPDRRAVVPLDLARWIGRCFPARKEFQDTKCLLPSSTHLSSLPGNEGKGSPPPEEIRAVRP